MASWLTRNATGARASLKVTPGAARDEVRGVEVDAGDRRYLAVRVCAPPEGGKANAALIGLLAKRWRIAKGHLAVVSGAASRRKVVQIEGSPDALIERLEALEAGPANAAGRR
jgi:uncharacterized protein (TIGR00251 family)